MRAHGTDRKPETKKYNCILASLSIIVSALKVFKVYIGPFASKYKNNIFKIFNLGTYKSFGSLHKYDKHEGLKYKATLCLYIMAYIRIKYF